QVAGGDGDLAQHPEHEAHRAGVVVAAGLRQIAPGDDAQLEGERLQQDGHQVGDHDDAEQRVAEVCAAGEIGGPVARVHVPDSDHVARAGEGERLAPERHAARYRDAVMRLRQARLRARVAPAFEWADGRRRDGAHRLSFGAQSTTCASSWPMMCRSPSTSTVTGPPNGWRSSKVVTTPGTSPSAAR